MVMCGRERTGLIVSVVDGMPDNLIQRALGEFLRRLPDGDVLVLGDSAAGAAEQISARAPAVHVGSAAPPGVAGSLVQRPATTLVYPQGAFAGCWAVAADPDEVAAAVRLIEPGGVLAMTALGPVGEDHVDLVTMPPVPRETPVDCVFCPPLRFRLNRMADLPGVASVLTGDDDFFVIPDLAPITEGHLLLVTTGHYLCSGALPEPLARAADRWLRRIRRLQCEVYAGAEPVVFEHGPERSQAAGACVDHTHWHIVPQATGMRAVVERTGLVGLPNQVDIAGTWRTTRTLHDEGRSYVLVDETVYPAENLRPQFLRWAAVTALHATPARTWRWQESFGRPSTQRRFLLTLDELLPAAHTLGSGR
jgi:diadenosine tetraphosphate (Ap4A) HIT family hydrolase